MRTSKRKLNIGQSAFVITLSSAEENYISQSAKVMSISNSNTKVTIESLESELTSDVWTNKKDTTNLFKKKPR